MSRPVSGAGPWFSSVRAGTKPSSAGSAAATGPNPTWTMAMTAKHTTLSLTTTRVALDRYINCLLPPSQSAAREWALGLSISSRFPNPGLEHRDLSLHLEQDRKEHRVHRIEVRAVAPGAR